MTLSSIQGRRNRGGQAPSFAKCPFPGAKCPFSCVKNVIKIAFFFPKGTFENLNLCYLRKFFFISCKNIIYPENFLVCPISWHKKTKATLQMRIQRLLKIGYHLRVNQVFVRQLWMNPPAMKSMSKSMLMMTPQWVIRLFQNLVSLLLKWTNKLRKSW